MKNQTKSLKNTMICWNDGGPVALIPWPDVKDIGGYLFMSDGACYTSVRKMNLNRRRHVLFEIASKIVVEYNCNPTMVHDVLKELEEYSKPLAQTRRYVC